VGAAAGLLVFLGSRAVASAPRPALGNAVAWVGLFYVL
jgi:hypothetical protein